MTNIFLLVNIMLHAGLNTCRLHAENGLIRCNTGKERVCAKAFPVASALGNTAHIHHRTKGDIDPFADMFFTHRNAARAEQRALPPAVVPIKLKGKTKRKLE